MPTVTDYLQSVQAGSALVQVTVSTWVRLTNNFTTATFISQAASSAVGQFTVLNVPAGSYALATGPSNTGPWTTQDSNYIVGDSTLQFSVKDYGAKGDGSTDDSTAIQNTINAANTAGGGTVYFPGGTYIASALTYFGKIKYLGAGIENTILKLKNATNTFLLQSNNFATLTGGNTTGGEFNAQFQDLTLDGNKANNGSATVPVFRKYGFGHTINNLRIRNGNNEGLYSEWSTSLTPLAPDSMEDHIQGLKVHDCGSNNVHWKGPHDSNWVNGQVFGSGARGIWVDTGGSGLLATDVHSYGNAQTYAWYLGDTGCVLNDCVAEGAITAQIGIDANDCAVNGSFVYAAGAVTPIGITIGVTASRSGTVIAGTKINNCTSGGISFLNDGGSFVHANVFQSSGNPTTGTINVASHVMVRADGVAGSVYQVPSNLSIKTGNALQLYQTSNAGFASLTFDGAIVQDSWGFKTASGLPLVAGGDFRIGTQNPAFGSPFTPVPANGAIIEMAALTGALTVNAPASIPAGQFIVFIWLQDGTGGRVITYNAAYHTTGAGALSTAANTRTVDTFVTRDGANYWLYSRQTGLT